MMAQINKDLLSKIDNLELSDRIRRWQIPASLVEPRNNFSAVCPAFLADSCPY